MKLKKFQREDLARSSLVDGLILGWDTGLGKTWAMFIWPLLKVGWERVRGQLAPKAPILIVAPGDLHDQICREANKVFKLQPVIIDSQATFQKLVTGYREDGVPLLAPGFYLTSYTALGRNGIMPWPDPDKWQAHALREWLAMPMSEVIAYFDGRDQPGGWLYEPLQLLFQGQHRKLTYRQAEEHYQLQRRAIRGEDAFVSMMQDRLDKAWDQTYRTFAHRPDPHHDDLSEAAREWLLRGYIHKQLASWRAGEGEVNAKGIKCVYSPTLSDLSRDAFACVVIDEGVKLKGDETFIATGVRQMAPKYRLVLTATPIKNRLLDLFWLASWAVGSPAKGNARFPYAATIEDKNEFASEFHVSERNLSKEEDTGRCYKKLTPQVCQVHVLWKFLGGLICRRRKQDCGEDIVPMHRHILRVPMGTEQAAVYKYHLDADYRRHDGLPNIGAQLQALRIVAADPTSTLLERVDGAKGNHRTEARLNPKIAATLKLIADIRARGEQVAVFSAFNDPLDTLSERLRACGVQHLVLDGRYTPKKRGKLSDQFQSGQVPVALAGVESMAEGHNWYRCPNIILLSYSWAFDKFVQAINRVHRMTSLKPVNLYSIICEGSIDRRLEECIREKSNASDLVLDGQLFDGNEEEVSLGELLRTAQREFDSQTKTVSEESIRIHEWPAIQSALLNSSAVRHIVPAPVPVARLLPPLTAVLPSQVVAPITQWRNRFQAELALA